MPTFVVVDVKVSAERLPCISNGIVGFQVDLFVLDAAPQAFNKHVVHPAALAIHTDFYIVVLEHLSKLVTGKLATLVSVEYLGTAVPFYVLFQRLYAEACFHGS